MGKTLVGLLPLIIAAAVLPMGIVMTLFWLRDNGGLTKATAFIAGRLFAQLLQGALVGYALKGAEDAAGAWGADRIDSWLLLIVGIVWLATALVASFRKPRPAAALATDAPPRRWVAALRRVSAPMAFGIGAVMGAVSMKQWFITAGAVALIDKAKLPPADAVLAYLYFAVAAQWLILTPVIVMAVAPARTPRLLTLAQRWMERNRRGITIAVSAVFGVWFIFQGII